jgi:hypothetical protein
MPTPEDITNPLIAALQSRIAEAEAPVAELTPDEQAESQSASEQSALARKYFSRDIIGEARKMAEDELPKNRFLRALVGMGEGAAQYYNPKTFKSREDRAFERLDKDFQRRGPVLQRDLAAYEGTAARNEQKRLDRQAKLQIADQKDRAEAQKLLLQNAKFLADDPVRKAKVEALISSSEFQKSKTKARDLENAFMAENGAKMGAAPTNAMAALMVKKNPELGAAIETQKDKDTFRKFLAGTAGKAINDMGVKRSVSYTPGITTIKNVNGVDMEVDSQPVVRTSERGGTTSPESKALLNLFLQRFGGQSNPGGVANAPGILGGSAASEGLPTVPSGRAERGAGSGSPLTGLQSATAVPSPGAPVAQRRGDKPSTNTPSRAQLAQVAARSGVPAPTTAGLATGGKLKIRPLTDAQGKPMSLTKEQDTRMGIDLQGALDSSIDILSGSDPEARGVFEKQMYPTKAGFWARVPGLRGELEPQREVDMGDWSRTKDPVKQRAYQRYKQLVANTAKAQWETAIQASGKAINKGEAEFINQILISLGGTDNKYIEDSPEQAMSKLVRQRLAIGALNLKMSAVKNGASDAMVGNLNLAGDMETAANRIMEKYKKGQRITAEDFRPEVNYPTLRKNLGGNLPGSSQPTSAPTSAQPPAASPVEDKQPKWKAAYQEALKKAGVIK